MPVAEFPGAFGWGYDGVDLFAPYHLYGAPDDLRRFVDRAHALGLGRDPRRRLQPPRARRELPRLLLADVLHRPLRRPSGATPLNFDGAESRPVRELFLANAGVLDRRVPPRRAAPRRHPEHLRPLARARPRRARRAARAPRPGRAIVLIVGENEPQDARLVRPRATGGCGLDALWNDDFHHTALVALTGPRRGATTRDYRGDAAGAASRR